MATISILSSMHVFLLHLNWGSFNEHAAVHTVQSCGDWAAPLESLRGQRPCSRALQWWVVGRTVLPPHPDSSWQSGDWSTDLLVTHLPLGFLQFCPHTADLYLVLCSCDLASLTAHKYSLFNFLQNVFSISFFWYDTDNRFAFSGDFFCVKYSNETLVKMLCKKSQPRNHSVSQRAASSNDTRRLNQHVIAQGMQRVWI